MVIPPGIDETRDFIFKATQAMEGAGHTFPDQGDTKTKIAYLDRVMRLAHHLMDLDLRAQVSNMEYNHR